MPGVPGTQHKIIQKKAKKKERYARLVRNRHRRKQNVFLAKAQDIDNIRTTENDYKIYHFSSGFIAGENNGKLDFEPSMLNKDYISNAVSIINDTDKVLTVTLHSKDSKRYASDEEIIKDWESRGDPYWTEWAQMLRDHLERHKKLIQKYMPELTTNKVDKKWMEKRNQYNELRNRLLSQKPCLEKTIRFDANSNCQVELAFNAKYISMLNYEFDEFAGKVLRQGIPRVRSEHVVTEELLKKDLQDYEKFFENKIQQHPPKETVLLGKDNILIKALANVRVTGYFVRQAAEIKFLVPFGNIEPDIIPSTDASPGEDLAEQLTNKDAEGREFLERYYFRRNEGPNHNLNFSIKEENSVDLKREATSSAGSDSFLERYYLNRSSTTDNTSPPLKEEDSEK